MRTHVARLAYLHSALFAIAAMGPAFLGVSCSNFQPVEIRHETSRPALTEENGAVIGNGSNLPNGATLPNGASLANGATLLNGTVLPNGAVLSNGATLANGVVLPNGAVLSNGVVLPNGAVLSNGAVLQNGATLSNGAILTNGATFPNGATLTNGATLASGVACPTLASGRCSKTGVISSGARVGAGGTLPPGTIVNNGTVVGNGTSFQAVNFPGGVTFAFGVTFPAGTILPPGTVLKGPASLPGGTVLPNGTITDSLTCPPTGICNNGINIAQGTIISTPGSALDAYLSDAAKRKVLKYVLQCAMTATQSVTLTWGTGSPRPSETVTGLVGLAATYRTSGSMSQADQEWVSACLLARVNQKGETVTVDMRGARPDIGLDMATSGFPAWEAVLWGNIFENPPKIYGIKNPAVSTARFCNADLGTCAPFETSYVGMLLYNGSTAQSCFSNTARTSVYNGVGLPLECGTYVFPNGASGLTVNPGVSPNGGFVTPRAITTYLPTVTPCVPQTCESAGAQCGPLYDGCGATLNCPGTCASGLECVANACKLGLTVWAGSFQYIAGVRIYSSVPAGLIDFMSPGFQIAGVTSPQQVTLSLGSRTGIWSGACSSGGVATSFCTFNLTTSSNVHVDLR